MYNDNKSLFLKDNYCLQKQVLG